MADAAKLGALRARVRALESGGADFGRAVVRLGEPLDHALPWGGLPCRALHEINAGKSTPVVFTCARPWIGHALRSRRG